MTSKASLILFSALVWVIPAFTQAAIPDPRDSVIVEQKVVAPVFGACASAPIKVRVWVTNKDSLANVTFPLEEKSISGGAYAIISRPANCSSARTSSTVFDFLYPPGPGTARFPTRVPSFSGYHSNSPDTFMFTGTCDPTDDDTKLPPNLTRAALLDIKFDSVTGLGQFQIDSTKVLGNTLQFVSTSGNAIFVNFVTGIIASCVPHQPFNNCQGASSSVLYGRPFNYVFALGDVPGTYSVVSGPGTIDVTGYYTFAGQCPLDLGGIPVTVRFTSNTPPGECGSGSGDCQFTIKVVDNPPVCSPNQPNITVPHGTLAQNIITATDPDSGDGTIISQSSGPGAVVDNVNGTADWNYQTSCEDVGRSPQEVNFLVRDKFGSCNPGPSTAACLFFLVVTNASPSITNCPSETISLRGGEPFSLDLNATDTDPGDSDIDNHFFLKSGPAGLTVSPSGVVNWTPDLTQTDTCAVIGVSDACGAADSCVVCFDVVSGQKFRLCIDVVHPRFQGGDVNVYINNLVEAFDPDCDTAHGGSGCVGGFSFLLTYDCSCLQFISASKGQLLIDQRWEFFTYRFGALGNGNCGSGCPTCLIRIVAIADINNSNIHPVPCPRPNQGQWVCLKFRTSSDLRLAGLCCPINWYWLDCTDNTVSDATGNCLWIACAILNTDGDTLPLPTEPVNVYNCRFNSGGENKPTPKPFIIFCNGQICLPPLESLDDRGDINLNGLANEIADAVLFESYFTYGTSVFVINVAGQTAATDINSDGRPLTIADLVALTRIITGDANPLPKANAGAASVDLNWSSDGKELKFTTSSTSEIGGLFVRFKYSGDASEQNQSALDNSMKLKAGVAEGELRVLINSDVRGGMIPAGKATFTVAIEGEVEFVEAQASNYQGQSLPVVNKKAALPTSFALSQNYPNPFNPKTNFVLSLPVASRYKVTIYNLLGEAVRTFEGDAAAGNKVITWDATDRNGNTVSSGIYFYKAVAGQFVDKKKMILMR